MNKTSTKTLITLLIVLISFIFIVEFTSPIQSINIGHLQKRQDPAPSPDKPPPKDDPPPPPPKDDPPPPPPKDNPPPPPKDDPPPPPKDNPPQESPPPPKDNPSPAPQPAPETTPNPNPTPDPNPTPPSDPNATPTPDPNATPTPDPSSPAPNPNVTPTTPDPNAPTPNPTTTVVSDTASNTVSPIVDSSVVTSPSGTTNADPNPNTGVSSISSTVSRSTTTTSYPPGREPCTKADDTRCGRRSTDPTVVSTSEENEIITEPLTTPAAPTKSQSQLAPNPKKSTITQFTTYTTTSTIYFPGYSTVTSSKGSDGELTTYATYIPPSTVVVVKKVTSAKVEEIQETNPSSAGHLDLELSVYNLYSIATSLFVITATMLYLIVA